MNYTPEKFREFYNKLPEDIKEAMFDVDSADNIKSIGQKHKLHIDQTGELSTQIGHVMLGVLSPSEFVRSLADKLNISTNTARDITEDVNIKIFGPIRESLKEVHKIREEKDLKINPSPTPNAFDQKMKEGFISEEKKSTSEESRQPRPIVSNDPYREPVE